MALNSKATHGSIPQHSQPLESPGIKALFHSLREQALIVDRTVAPGFGVVSQGTIMSRDADGIMFPYAGEDHQDTTNQARVFALADLVDTQDTINVLKDKAGMFVVGKDLMLVRNNGGAADAHDAGAIVSVDLDSNPNFAVVTFTNAVSGANFTVANLTNAYLKADTSEADGLLADCIIDKDIDTGEGEKALGGLTSVVLSNAVLYLTAIPNLDDEAITDLGAVNDGRFLILK